MVFGWHQGPKRFLINFFKWNDRDYESAKQAVILICQFHDVTFTKGERRTISGTKRVLLQNDLLGKYDLTSPLPAKRRISTTSLPSTTVLESNSVKKTKLASSQDEIDLKTHLFARLILYIVAVEYNSQSTPLHSTAKNTPLSSASCRHSPATHSTGLVSGLGDQRSNRLSGTLIPPPTTKSRSWTSTPFLRAL